MRRSGQMTVFLGMIILCVCALMSGLLESARTAGTRWYFKMAAAASLDSVMSGYHRKLWDRYHLLLLETEGNGPVEEAISAYMKMYDEENNLYPMRLLSVEARDLTRVTDYGGEPLEREIVEYMKMGFLNQNKNFEDLGETLGELMGVKELKEMSALYERHAGEAFLMEQSLESIGDSLEAQRALIREGEERLDGWNGSGFIRTAGKLIREMERMPKLVKEYEGRADALGRSLDETEKVYAGKREILGDSAVRALEAEMESYREYTDQDGRRRREILSVGSETEAGIPVAREAVSRAEEVMDYINSWEGEDEDDELDEEPLWRSVLAVWKRIQIPKLTAAHGIADKEKKSFLERVRDLASFDLMKYVIPEDREVSKAVFSSAHPLPSGGREEKNWAVPEILRLPARLAAAEYGGIHFNHFVDDQRAVPEYEMEYLLSGGDSDEANLETVVRKLLMVREGANLLYLMTNREKREEARALAAVIVGAAGLAPLVYVTAFFVLCIWALGEALLDVRALLAGGKIPVMKDDSSWTLSLEQLLNLGETGALPGGQESDEGLDYEAYLKMLLMVHDGETVNYRMMDVMQINVGEEQKSFRMDRMVYRVRGSVRARGRYLTMKAELDKAY